MKILFITARLPYPPHKGDQVVPYHRLRLLSRQHQITLVSFYEQEADLAALATLEKYCEKIVTVKLTKREGILNMLRYGLFSRRPFQVLYYTSSAFEQAIGALPLQHFDLIHTFMLRVAHYTPVSQAPRLLELIDSMELNFSRRLPMEKWYWKALVKEEIRRLQRYERKMVGRFEAAIVVSAIDKEMINHPKVHCIPLGVDGSVFYPAAEEPREPILVFSGNMGYYANEKSLLWFLAHCWESIKAKVPRAKLYIVGTNPTQRLRWFTKDSSIVMTSFVASVADELRKAQVAIAPMQSGSGMQNKILEAMASRLPVVSTTVGLGDIKAKHQHEVMVADTKDAFTESCVSLLQSDSLRSKLGQRGLSLVQTRYTWEANVAAFQLLAQQVSSNPNQNDTEIEITTQVSAK